MATAAEIRARVDAVPYWWHSIDVGEGVVTPGFKWGGGLHVMEHERARMGLPGDYAGRSVLDVGSYDGFYAFDAERRGAGRVVAIDHFVWLHDLAPGGPPVDFSLAYLKPDGLPPTGAQLPGKRAFDCAHELLGSRVESVVADFMHYDLARLGAFDVVLYLGIVYHMEEPLTALRRVRSVCNEFAVIESEVVRVDGHEQVPLARLVPSDDVNEDPTNWWVPNVAGLVGLARGAGFGRVEVIGEPTPPHATTPEGLPLCRATIHAYV
jgi:tRNA (mo5U34)-methyltransferase